jgi:hypothetical protein
VLPALLLLVALVAGWRTIASMRVVLGGGGARPASADRVALAVEESNETRLLQRTARDDSLLAALASGRLPADPFRARRSAVSTTVRPTLKPSERPVETPSVVLSAFDAARPEIILRIGDRVSGRLAQGQSWEGWTVVSIDRAVVEISGFDRTVRLQVPNQTSIGG